MLNSFPIKYFCLVVVIFIGFAFLLTAQFADPRVLLLNHFSAQTLLDPNNLSGEIDSNPPQAFFDSQPVDAFRSSLAEVDSSGVLGEGSGSKRVEVDLTNQRLYAFEGDRKVFDFLVSTGKWGKTPTGRFRIWVKLRATLMKGGSKALGTYYYLPNVPYTMYFYNDQTPKWVGYGIHGAYWHNNFGHPMSHGCVNMKTEEAQQLFYWAQPDLRGRSNVYASDSTPGTEIIIYGTAPTT